MINSIQALRAYAALSVLVGHAVLEAAATSDLAPPLWTKPLLQGVDVFFVVSGFVMMVTAGSNFGSAAATLAFWQRRVLRVVPLYWLFTTLMVGALLVAADSVRSTELVWNDVLYSYLFWPEARDGGRVAPILSLGWTLNYEMMFYFLFGLSLLLSRNTGIILMLLALVVLALGGQLVDIGWTPLRFWANPIVLEFGLGMLIGLSLGYLRSRASSLLATALMAAGFVLLYLLPMLPLHRLITGGVPASLIVIGCILLPRKQDASTPPFLVLLGAASYSLYLSHRFVLRGATITFEKLHLADSSHLWTYVAATTLIGVVVALAVYLAIERPVMDFFRHRGRRNGNDADVG